VLFLDGRSEQRPSASVIQRPGILSRLASKGEQVDSLVKCWLPSVPHFQPDVTILSRAGAVIRSSVVGFILIVPALVTSDFMSSSLKSIGSGCFLDTLYEDNFFFHPASTLIGLGECLADLNRAIKRPDVLSELAFTGRANGLSLDFPGQVLASVHSALLARFSFGHSCPSRSSNPVLLGHSSW
jgi:hypothetical protein